MSGEMLHEDIRETLSAYLDGRADDPRTVEQHLQQCAACRHELAELREVQALLRRMPVLTAPRSFAVDELSLRRRRKQQQFGGVNWALRSVVAVAAVLLLFVAGGDIRDALTSQTGPQTSIGTSTIDSPTTDPNGQGRVATPPNIRTVEPAVYRGLEAALLGTAAVSGGVLWYLGRRRE